MDEAPKYDVEECKARDATYAAPLKVKVRLRNKETGEIKEQEIFMGDFPLMTHSGTFVINGAERVVVSQIVRSPGVYYSKEIDIKTDLPILSAQIIPQRGAWLEYETDANELLWASAPTRRSESASAATPGLWPLWRRTPARPTRSPCWRSTAVSAPVSPPRWRPPRP